MPAAQYGNPMPQPVAAQATKNRNIIIAVLASVLAVLLVIGAVVLTRPASSSGHSGIGKPGVPEGTWSFSISSSGLKIKLISIDVDKDGVATLSSLDKKYLRGDLTLADYDKESVTYDVKNMKVLVNDDDYKDFDFKRITMPRTGVVGKWIVDMNDKDESGKFGINVSSNHDITFNWDTPEDRNYIDATWEKTDSSSATDTYVVENGSKLMGGLLGSEDNANDSDKIQLEFTIPSDR